MTSFLFALGLTILTITFQFHQTNEINELNLKKVYVWWTDNISFIVVG